MAIGMPGSGKSRLGSILNVERVCRDDIGSSEKVCKMVDQLMSDKKCVYIDNTNPDEKTRSKYIQLAQSHHYRYWDNVSSIFFNEYLNRFQ